MPTLPDEEPIEADWSILRPERHAPAPSREPEQPITPDHLGDAEEFVERLQDLAEAVINPRSTLRGVRNDLFFLCIDAGANPRDIPDALWAETADDYRTFADAIGYVPRTEPSTPLGLQLVSILTNVRRGSRAGVSERLLGIAQQMRPAQRGGRR